MRLKRLKGERGYNIHVKTGLFWRKVGHFKDEDEALQRLDDVAELNRGRDPR